MAATAREKYIDVHEPFIRLLDAIFNDPYGRNPYTVKQKVRWVQEHLPKTYALASALRDWEVLSEGED